MKAHLRKIFRIFYKSFFLLLVIVLCAVLIVTPADAIQQARRNTQPYNIYIILIAYGFTFALSAFWWSIRWYTNVQALKAIPKTWVPVEKEDVSKKVRKMIVASLNRSATIAWDARPRTDTDLCAAIPPTNMRDPPSVIAKEESEKRGTTEPVRKSESQGNDSAITIAPPVWGNISHDGWSSPASLDLPNLQYITVILELPHLIEARAVSLAPAEALSTTDPPQPDIRAIGLLQRPASMGLREYIGHLTSIGTITEPNVAMEFLSAYEYARFSGRPLSESQFQEIMKQFAEVLRTMQTVAPSVLDGLNSDDEEEGGGEEEESDLDGDATSATTPTTPLSRRSHTSLRSTNTQRSGTEGDGPAVRTAPSRGTATTGGTPTPSRGNAFSTAPGSPATPRSRQNVQLQQQPQYITRSPSSRNLFSRSRQPYTGSTGSERSSLRSVSQGSVIRLSQTNESHDLPYVLNVPVPAPGLRS